MLCVYYFGITSYSYCIFCFVRSIMNYTKPIKKEGYYTSGWDTITILMLIIICIYRGGIMYSIKKYGESIQKVDSYHRNEKQEKFISSIETKIGNIEGGSFNWN